MAIASLQHITHHFADQCVLSDFSLEFKEKKITALLGKSGSGKSTILKMINGMVQPQQGRVLVFGASFDPDKAAETRLKIGYAVQHTGLFPHLNIEANIGLLGKVTQKSRAYQSERTAFLMDTMQLPKSFLRSFPHQLSGGEQQRVGLCRAFFLQPPLVLMDEPFASLDYKTKGSIYNYLLDLQKQEPTSIILVTHQFEEAELLCDEFVWIQEGQVLHQGEKHRLSNLETAFKAG